MIGDDSGIALDGRPAFVFVFDDVPYASDNTALQFIKFNTDQTEMWIDPSLNLRWEPDAVDAAEPSELLVSFMWRTVDEDDIMDERDVANCLEHFVDWSD